MRSLGSSWRRSALRSQSTPGVARCPNQGAFARFSSVPLQGIGGPNQDHPPPPSPPPPPLTFLDVPYFEGEGACGDKHLLDVYIPSAPFPRPRARTCLFVHGGSWQRGDRRHPAVPDQFYGNVGRTFAAHGLVGLVMSYRLAPGVQHPEQVRDVARAIRWARDNASRYGGDGGDLVVVGHSAGAHLAALCLADGRWLAEAGALALPESPLGGAGSIGPAAAVGPTGGGDDDDARAPSRGPPPTLSSLTPATPVSGFVGISGVYDIPRMAGNVVGGILARAAFGNDRRTWQRVSPVHCVRINATRSSRGDGDALSTAVDPAAGLAVRSGEAAETSSAGACAPPKTAGAANTGFLCPLLHTEVLLLTAGTDFHLEDDAQALAEALDHARLESARHDPARAAAGGDRGGDDPLNRGERRAGGRKEAGGEERGVQRWRRREGMGATFGNDEPLGDESLSAGGSVRHVRLEGEDHLSVMVSFGEPDTHASKAVMDFVLGIRKSKP